MEKNDFMHRAGQCAALMRASGLHVILVGMPGSGKSRLGRAIARFMGLAFRDSDKLIEHKENASVADIFASKGEAYFRMSEEQAILELLAQPPCIIATGGGAVMNERLREAMQARGVTVWVQAAIEEIALRLKGDDSRPLLRGGDTAETLRRLAAEREPHYATSILRIHPGAQETEEAARTVIDLLCARAKIE